MKIRNKKIAAGILSALLAFSAFTIPNDFVYVPIAEAATTSSASSGFSYSSTASTITLKWKEVSGADAYKIYKYNSSAKTWEKVNFVSGTSCKIEGLKKNTTYTFKVTPFKKEGKKYVECGESKKVSAKTKSSDLPKVASDFSGLLEANGSTFCFEKGKPVTGLKTIDGSTYYFDKTSYAAKTGWLVINDSDHYFYKSGKMAKNATIKIDGDYYSFDSEGNIIGLNREEVALAKAVATYITQFKNPSSVKIVGEVKKFDKAKTSYIKENIEVGYGTVSGYLLNISATNGFGGRTSTKYYLITDKSGFKTPAHYSDIPSYGFISVDEDPFPYALVGVASSDAKEINVDVNKVNNTIAEYVESIGY